MLLAIFFLFSTILLSISLPIGIAYPLIIKNIYSSVATFHFFLIPLYAYINVKIQMFLLKRTNSIPDEEIRIIKPFRDHSVTKPLERDSYLFGFIFFCSHAIAYVFSSNYSNNKEL